MYADQAIIPRHNKVNKICKFLTCAQPLISNILKIGQDMKISGRFAPYLLLFWLE